MKFMDENHQLVEWINYGTGENAICNDFFTFLDHVRSNYPDIKQSLTTNGYLYEAISKDDEKMDIYKRAIDEVDVSLDFADKEKHNSFRGQPSAYTWAINMLKQLKEDLKLSTIVFVGFEETMQKENIDGLFKIAKENNAILRLNIYRPVSETLRCSWCWCDGYGLCNLYGFRKDKIGDSALSWIHRGMEKFK